MPSHTPPRLASDPRLTTRECLRRAIEGLSQGANLEGVMAVVCRAARGLCQADGAIFILRDGAQVHYASEDASQPMWKGLRVPAEACISGWVMRQREPLVIADVHSDARVVAGPFRSDVVQSLVMVPIRPADPLGAVAVYWEQRTQPSPRKVFLLEQLANHAAIATASALVEQQLRAGIQSRDDFMGVVVRELRAPFGALQSGLDQWVQTRGGSADPSLALQQVTHATEGLAELVDDLEDMALLAGGSAKLQLKEEELDLSVLARNVVRRLESSARTQGCPVSVGCDTPVMGRWDRRRIEQVITHLLLHACTYGKGHQVDVDLVPDERMARLTVRDRGPEVPFAEQAGLFERFPRASVTRPGHGLGVGLWLARLIVEAHGGEVLVNSRKGEGVTLVVMLPLRRERILGRASAVEDREQAGREFMQ